MSSNHTASGGNISRRRFLQNSLIASCAAAGAVPYVFSSRARADEGLDRIRIGAIGCGDQGRNDLNYFDQIADIPVICDIDTVYGLDKTLKTGIGVHRGGETIAPETCTDYRRVLDRDDIDAVMIVTPDHWHTKIAIEALQAGKHVFCEKPLTLTIAESLALRKAAAKYGKVFQVGTMQRCFLNEFMLAALIVRGGHLGTIKKITVDIGGGDVSPEIPAAEVPSWLDWNTWLGQAPQTDYLATAAEPGWDVAVGQIPRYTRGHYSFRWWYEYAGGKFTDWGAHHIDIAMWATNRLEKGDGPVSIDGTDSEHPVEFKDGYPTVHNRYNTANRFNIYHTFPDGMVMNVCSESPDGNGILFEGTKGRIHVSRGRVKGKCIEEGIADLFTEDDYIALNNGLPLTTRFEWEKDPERRALLAHKENFLCCVRSGGKPISDIESHVQSLHLCHLSAIAARLKRTIAWDSKNETIVGDDQAALFLSRPRRAGFEIPEP